MYDSRQFTMAEVAASCAITPVTIYRHIRHIRHIRNIATTATSPGYRAPPDQHGRLALCGSFPTKPHEYQDLAGDRSARGHRGRGRAVSAEPDVVAVRGATTLFDSAVLSLQHAGVVDPIMKHLLELAHGRDDVEDGEPSHGLRVVQGHPVSDSGAAVVADDGEAVVPESCHQLDEFGGHLAFGVALAVLAAGWACEPP